MTDALPRPRAIAFGEVLEWLGGPWKREEKRRHVNCNFAVAMEDSGELGSAEMLVRRSVEADVGGV